MLKKVHIDQIVTINDYQIFPPLYKFLEAWQKSSATILDQYSAVIKQAQQSIARLNAQIAEEEAAIRMSIIWFLSLRLNL